MSTPGRPPASHRAGPPRVPAAKGHLTSYGGVHLIPPAGPVRVMGLAVIGAPLLLIVVLGLVDRGSGSGDGNGPGSDTPFGNPAPAWTATTQPYDSSGTDSSGTDPFGTGSGTTPAPAFPSSFPTAFPTAFPTS